MASKWDGVASVQNFREYLRIESVYPDVDYTQCVEFLRRQAAGLGLPITVVELVPKKPVVIISWAGLEPDLPSIMLNSHMDVVVVVEDLWTHPPFSAHITEDGWIYARGAQDMKNVGIQYLEAVRKLKEAGQRLKRTVHVTFVPDEEVGGHEGMRVFAESQQFSDLNVGFVLDESCASPTEEYIAFYGERITMRYKIICPGEPMHGSQLCPETAGEKLHHVLDKFMKYRVAEMRRLNTGTPLGAVTTVNLTLVEGGLQINVLPEKLSASFDCRVAPDVDLDEFENMIIGWCKEAGKDVICEVLHKNSRTENTVIDSTNHFWTAFMKASNDMNLKVNFVICPGQTDARYIRAKGVPAIGFSPLANTPLLLHAHDERIHVNQFLKGIEIYENVLKGVANV